MLQNVTHSEKKPRKQRLEDLMREKKARAMTESWREKRKKFMERCQRGDSPEGGELANFLDGLTPDGYNKAGKKVSFIERGKFAGRSLRISGHPIRITNDKSL